MTPTRRGNAANAMQADSNPVALIKLVKEHSDIWDRRKPRNRALIGMIWSVIAEKLHSTPEKAKSNWNRIRAYYMKNGASYYLAKNLSFLADQPKRIMNNAAPSAAANQQRQQLYGNGPVWRAEDIYSDSEEEAAADMPEVSVHLMEPPPAHQAQTPFYHKGSASFMPNPGPSHRLNYTQRTSSGTNGLPQKIPKTEPPPNLNRQPQNLRRGASLQHQVGSTPTAPEESHEATPENGNLADVARIQPRPRGSSSSAGKKPADDFLKNIGAFMGKMSQEQKDAFKDGVYALVTKILLEKHC